ncbi:pickpocket protein 19-like, partial [Asbolus verrucosus]
MATKGLFHSANLTRRDPEEMMEYIRFIGQLYDFDSERSSFSKLLEFQNILEKLQMTVAYVARQVATPCEELLKNCYWKNVRVNCSSIFTMRQTHDGYCCVFNYVKLTSETLDYEVNKEPMTTEAGVENGLYVSVNNNLEDYYYTTLSSAGIHTFVPTDYPDKPSGSVTEILTQPNSENFVEIVPTTLTSVEDVVSYPIEKRGCFFEYERSTLLGNIYSQSDCHVDCRIVSIQAMCQCIPFMIPFSTNETVCTLADIPCLNRYR